MAVVRVCFADGSSARGPQVTQCTRASVLADRKARAAAHFKEELDEITSEQRRLARIVEDHAEPRITKCRWVGDFSEKVWRLYRVDTGELIDSETMTAADLQPSLLS